MSRKLLSYLFFPVFVIVSALSTASPALGQCGTYFRSEYRAIGKIQRVNTYLGGDFVLSDWTGDGRSDFWNFRFNQATQKQDVVIYPALATGYWNWDAPIIYTTTLGTEATTVNSGPDFSWTIRDFDSDGKADMLIMGMGNPNYKIHRNMGNGTLVPQATIVSPGDADHYVIQIGFGDVNGDGRLDWIYRLKVISTGEESFNYSIQNADGSISAANLMLANGGGNEVNNSINVLGDYDGDGDIDIMYKSVTDQLRVLRNMGGGTFTLANPSSIGSFSWYGVGDLNNDGRLDAYGRTFPNNNLAVFSAQSDATFTVATYPLTITNSTAALLRPVDFNGDGRLDLIYADYLDYEVLLNNPGGGFTSHYYPGRLVTSYPSLYAHFEDFSADGKADLYETHHDIFNTFGEELVVIKSNVCDFKGQTRGMSFDSNPTPDIVNWNGTNSLWRSANGDWYPLAPPFQTFGWGLASLGDVPAPGDFDGDGQTDYTVYRNGEGKWYVDLSSTTASTEFHFGAPGDIPIPNDYNGGGKTDYAVFRPSDGNWYIWYTETQQFEAIHWGANGDRPVPADFDGDGKTDIAVFRPSTGDWFYVRSSDSGIVINHWGTSGDVSLPADYDGDGKADLAVFRSGVWHFLRSSNGAYAPVFWGISSDIPLPFLEKGEVSIPVVYRPSNSHWYSARYPIGWALPLGGGTPVYFGLPN